MVQSKIDPKIVYEEITSINPKDKNHVSFIYELEIINEQVNIVIGKENKEYLNNTPSIIYYRIYVINQKEKNSQKQIGIYELEEKDIFYYTDSDGDLVLDKLEPLLFSFVDPLFIKCLFNPADNIAEIKHHENPKEPEEDDDDDDNYLYKKPLAEEEREVSEKNDEIQGIFTVKPKKREILEKETETISKQYNKDYKNLSNTGNYPWIVDFAKNTNFSIEKVAGDGNCFFLVIVEAFKDIGWNTTVDKLRNVVAENITPEIYNNEYGIYLLFKNNLFDKKQELDIIEKRIQEIKQLLRKKMQVSSGDEKQLTEELTNLSDKKMLNKIRQEIKQIEQDIETIVPHLSKLDSFEKYKEYILTNNFWANEFAIQILEEKLNIKMLNFKKWTTKTESKQKKFLDTVFSSLSYLEKGKINPEYYIMTSYSEGNHYDLIRYMNHGIFQFDELPFVVKELGLIKSIENSNNVFNQIQDFIKYKTEKYPELKEKIVFKGGSKTNDEVVFSIFIESPNTPIEKINELSSLEFLPHKKVSKYIELSRPEYADWRRKLSDDWETKLILDDHHWNSITHYLLASQYKNTPAFYLQFTDDNGNEIGKNVDIAKAVANTGKWKEHVYKSPTTQKDSDFNYDTCRNKALEYKLKNDFRKILLLTQDSKLKIFKRGKPQEDDVLLMGWREKYLQQQ